MKFQVLNCKMNTLTLLGQVQYCMIFPFDRLCPCMLYGTECWAVKNQHENQVSVAEMRMLRWMSGKTGRDRIRNDTMRESWGSTYSRKCGRKQA